MATSANASFKTNARSAFLIDATSGAVIMDKAGDELMPPSSMLKMMTLAVVFDEIKAGRLKMDESLNVPATADYNRPAMKPASKICLVTGQRLSMRDALLGTIVMSGGDATITLATRISGDEEKFAAAMNRRAREIGMPRSTFGNSSGLPHPDNMMTSRELATLAQYLMEEHPDLYPLFATQRFEFSDYRSAWCAEWGRTKTMNYNRLLFIMPGADGLKTGSTRDGGYGLTASATRGGRRLIGVINGLKVSNHDALAREMQKLLNYGFDTTRNHNFFAPGDEIARVPLWYGRKPNVGATVAKPFAITLPRDANVSAVRVVARYSEPLRAPVRIGDVIGEIIATKDGAEIARMPLVASEKVGRTRFIGRIWQNIKIIFGIK